MISAAVLLADYNLSRAMTRHHQLFRSWLGVEARTWLAPDALPDYLSEVRTPKRHIMLLLAAVLASWEKGLSRESWRRPDPWNSRVLTTGAPGGAFCSSTVTAPLPSAASTIAVWCGRSCVSVSTRSSSSVSVRTSRSYS